MITRTVSGCKVTDYTDKQSITSSRHRYSQRGAWVQSQAILKYLQLAGRLTPTVTSVGKPLHLSPLCYYHTISALASAQGFAPALDLYKEMQVEAKESGGNFRPHPLAVAPLLQMLSQWNDVTNAGVMMAICEEVAQIAISLSRMTDDNFQRMHSAAGGGGADGDCDGERQMISYCSCMWDGDTHRVV